MILCDTGPMVALIDRSDRNHERCADTLDELPNVPLITTWPCVTEAMHLLGKNGGFAAQSELWEFLDDGTIVVDAAIECDRERIRDLMREYADTPMDIADASLVALAERLGTRRIFTLDSHFRFYRISGTDSFDVVP